MLWKHPRTFSLYITKTKGKALRKEGYESLDHLANSQIGIIPKLQPWKYIVQNRAHISVLLAFKYNVSGASQVALVTKKKCHWGQMSKNNLAKWNLIACISNRLEFFFFFWMCYAAFRILVPWPGIKPLPPALRAQSLNHWTAREVSHGLEFQRWPFHIAGTLKLCPVKALPMWYYLLKNYKIEM